MSKTHKCLLLFSVFLFISIAISLYGYSVLDNDKSELSKKVEDLQKDISTLERRNQENLYSTIGYEELFNKWNIEFEGEKILKLSETLGQNIDFTVNTNDKFSSSETTEPSYTLEVTSGPVEMEIYNSYILDSCGPCFYDANQPFFINGQQYSSSIHYFQNEKIPFTSLDDFVKGTRKFTVIYISKGNVDKTMFTVIVYDKGDEQIIEQAAKILERFNFNLE